MNNKDKIPFGLVALAALSFVIGFIGFVFQDPFWLKPNLQTSLQELLDVFYATIQVFVLDAPKTVAEQGPIGFWSWVLINVARVLAPLSLAGALLSALSGLWKPIIERQRMAFLGSHTIVFGASDVAQVFIENELKLNRPVACFVTTKGEKQILERAFEQEVLILAANPSNVQNWKNISVLHASDILLLAGDDCANLGAMHLLKCLWQDVQIKTRTTNLFVHIADETLRSELIAQTGKFSAIKTLDIRPISVNELAARYFFHQRDFFYDTHIAGFERVHWLIFGFTNSSVALLRQFLKVSAFARLAKPHVSLIVPNVDQAKDRIRDMFGAQGILADFSVFQADAVHPIPDLEMIQAIEKEALVSAVFISLGSDRENQKCATLLQGVRVRTGCLKGEILLDKLHNNAGWIENPNTMSNDNDNEICALVHQSKYCSLDFLKGPYDRVARGFHDAYAKISSDAQKWQALDENFKQANRRAADHAKTKMESLGFIGPLGDLKVKANESLNLSEVQLEQLARLEHQSWMADRLENGWNYGPTRNNLQRLHPNLLPYDKLSETIKNLDRDQVKLFFNQLLKPGKTSTLQHQVRVALIGHNAISLTDAALIKNKLADEFLPKLAKEYSNSKICFFSPLAPGSDLVMVNTVFEVFETLHKNWTCQIVSTMPVDHIVRHYANNWQAARTWNGNDENTSGRGLDKDWAAARIEMTAHLNNLATNSNHVSQKIDLMPAFRGDEFWDKEANSTAAFLRGGHYLAHTADILIAFLDTARSSGPGGTEQTVQIARERGIPLLLV